MTIKPFNLPYRATSPLLLGLLLLGFWLRLAFIFAYIFHADEFISLLAISRILALGLPIFPSGQFYDHGLLYSYIAAAYALVAGFDEVSIRFVSLSFSLLAIALIYRAGATMFRNRLVGLLAALIMTLYAQAILWGGRARMYSLAQLLGILAVLLVWLGIKQASWRYRLAGYLALFGALFCHLSLILLVPALVVAGVCVLWLEERRQWRQVIRQKGIWLETALAVALIVMVLLTGQQGFIARQSANREVLAADQPNDPAALLVSVVNPASAGQALDSVLHYFEETDNKPLVALSLFGVVMMATHFVMNRTRRNATGESSSSSPVALRPFSTPTSAAYEAAFFVTVLLAVLLFEAIVILGSTWNNGRYYFLWYYPLLSLLAGYGTALLAGLSQRFVQTRWVKDSIKTDRAGQWLALVVVVLVSGWLTITLLGQSMAAISEPFKTYRYDLGWKYVSEHAAQDDTSLTSWPSAAALYNRKTDYYTNQTRSLAMFHPTENKLTDQYAGATYLATAAELNAVLEQSGRTWYVVEDARIFNFLEAEVVQQIFHQMRLEQSIDNIHIFVEKEGRWPLAERPDKAMAADLSGQMIFNGYALQPEQPQRGQPLYLTLFWQPVAPVFNYKIFVHLRNDQNQTVAQADFVPLEGVTVDLKGWLRRMGPTEQLATGTMLQLPPEMPPGDYSLWIGMYEPLSGQRLPVSNDSTGENAIRLAGVVVVR